MLMFEVVSSRLKKSLRSLEWGERDVDGYKGWKVQGAC